MEFEYTSTITIDEIDMDRIYNGVKNGEDFGDVFDDVISEYDDCDYYHMGDIYDDVEKEIERRIKESEKEETKMPMITRDMTDEELIALRKVINETLADRKETKVNEAIENFHKAFEKLKEVVFEIRVGKEWENCLVVDDFEDFDFEY